MTEEWKDEVGEGLLVQRQGHAPPSAGLARQRLARSAPRCWCRHRGARRSARPSPTRSARCSRCRAPPPPAARPRWSACRWRSIASTKPAASTAGRSSWSSRTTSPSPTSAAARPRSWSSRTRSTRTSAASCPTSASPACRCGRRHKIVNMISVCLDTTHHHHQVQPLHASGRSTTRRRRRWRFAPYLVNKIGKKWHIAYADYSWGQSTTRRLCRRRSRRPAARWSAPPASRSAPPT